MVEPKDSVLGETTVADRPVGRLQRFIESDRMQNAIYTVIMINAVTLGLDTSATITRYAGDVLSVIDIVIIGIFVFEIGAKLAVYRWRFFTDYWNIFDFFVVALTVLPWTGNLSILRALRVLRVLRLVSMSDKMRLVVQALLDAVPGIASVGGLLALLFYVFGVMATKFFGADFEAWFGTLGRSMYTLFQIMTLESWSMGIVRPVMELFPYAWLFFLPFILLASFAVLNLFVAIIVNSMQALEATERSEAVEASGRSVHHDTEALHDDVAALRREIRELRGVLATPGRS